MKDDRLYRLHILESIDKISAYVDGMSREDFLQSILVLRRRATQSAGAF